MSGYPQPDVRSLLRELSDGLGPELIGVMCGLEGPAPLKTWMTNPPNVKVEAKLRIGYKVFSGIARSESPNVARAWCLGMNPHLSDANPLVEIGAGRGLGVLAAARAYRDGSFR